MARPRRLMLVTLVLVLGTLIAANVSSVAAQIRQSKPTATSIELTKESYPLICLYDKLLDIDTSGNLVPELAVSWEVSPDGTTYNFELRPNVQFHDGSSLTASAVKSNMEQTLPIFPGFLRKSPLEKGTISQVSVVDDLTVQVVLPAPNPGFLQQLTGLDGMMAAPTTTDSVPVGAGPFEFVNFVPLQQLDFQAFSSYWGGQPQVSALTFWYIPDELARWAALASAQLQSAAGMKTPARFDDLDQRGFILCGIPIDFQAVFPPAAIGFECFPDGAMRFENVTGSETLRVGVPNFEDGPAPPPPPSGADLSISKSDDPDPLTVGNILTYTVVVDNSGPEGAEDVVVTDTLQSGVTFVATSGCAEDPNGLPGCCLGAIPSGGSAQFTITVEVDTGTSRTITNTASVDSFTTDPRSGNNSTTERTNVIQHLPPPKVLTKESYPLISLYDKLLDIDTSGNLVPELAESWEVSPDGITKVDPKVKTTILAK